MILQVKEILSRLVRCDQNAVVGYTDMTVDDVLVPNPEYPVTINDLLNDSYGTVGWLAGRLSEFSPFQQVHVSNDFTVDGVVVTIDEFRIINVGSTVRLTDSYPAADLDPFSGRYATTIITQDFNDFLAGGS